MSEAVYSFYLTFLNLNKHCIHIIDLYGIEYQITEKIIIFQVPLLDLSIS